MLNFLQADYSQDIQENIDEGISIYKSPNRLAKTMNFYFLSGVDFKTVVGQLKELYQCQTLSRLFKTYLNVASFLALVTYFVFLNLELICCDKVIL